jgi:hypothetical protein
MFAFDFNILLAGCAAVIILYALAGGAEFGDEN